MESHAGYVHAALQQALAEKELGLAEIERALLAISDEEMQQVERPICRRLVAECHDLLFALHGQLPPAQEEMAQSLARVKRSIEGRMQRRRALRFSLRACAALFVIAAAVLAYDLFAPHAVLQGTTIDGGQTYRISGRQLHKPLIGESSADPVDEPSMTSTKDLSEAYAVLDCEPATPSWVPEGWVQEGYFAVATSDTKRFTARYAHPQQHDYLKYSWMQFAHPEHASGSYFQDSEGTVENWNGQEVYLTTNTGYNLVIWTGRDTEHSLGGPVPFEDLRRIFDSFVP